MEYPTCPICHVAMRYLYTDLKNGRSVFKCTCGYREEVVKPDADRIDSNLPEWSNPDSGNMEYNQDR